MAEFSSETPEPERPPPARQDFPGPTDRPPDRTRAEPAAGNADKEDARKGLTDDPAVTSGEGVTGRARSERARAHEEAARAVAREYAASLRGPGHPRTDSLDAGADRPDFTNAEIDPRKIDDYAMNPQHALGRHKYRVISSATGLDVGDARNIRDQILEKVQNVEQIPGKEDEYGRRWSADVDLAGPRGTVTIRTAWIVDRGSANPRLTTISFPPEKDR